MEDCTGLTLGDIITAARFELQDHSEPYRWLDSQMIRYANDAEREACRRAHLIIDKTTPAYCLLHLTPYKSAYSVDEKVLSVLEIYLGPRMVATTLSWTAATMTLADSANGFLTAGFKANTTIIVSGFANAANNGRFTIQSVAAGAIVVAETTMVNEAATPSVLVQASQIPLGKKTRGQLDEMYSGIVASNGIVLPYSGIGPWQDLVGQPQAWVQESDNEFLLVPVPVEANTISMVVSRLPKADMATMATDSPEIPLKYHYNLIDWMCYRAASVNNSQQDIPEARVFEDRFAKNFGMRPSAVSEQFRRNNPRNLRMRPKEFGF